MFTCDILRDLVTSAQFKKREKHSWRNVKFSKIAGFTFYTIYTNGFIHIYAHLYTF